MCWMQAAYQQGPVQCGLAIAVCSYWKETSFGAVSVLFQSCMYQQGIYDEQHFKRQADTKDGSCVRSFYSATVRRET